MNSWIITVLFIYMSDTAETKNKRYAVNDSKYQMVKRKNLDCRKKKERFNLSGGEICIVPFTNLCLRHPAAPTHLVQLRPLRQEQKCGIQFSSVRRGAAAQTRRTAAAPDHCGRRRQSAAPSAATAAFNNKPVPRLLKGKRDDEDIFNAFASAAARFLLGNRVCFHSETCAAGAEGVGFIRSWWFG